METLELPEIEEEAPANNMVMIDADKKWWLDGYVKANLDHLKKDLHKDYDAFLICDGQERLGKCQTKSSKVLMANGEWKNIEDVKVDDEVLSPQQNGSYIFAKVTNISNWFCNEVYDVVELNRQHKKLYSCSYNHSIPINFRTMPRQPNKSRSKNSKWIITHYDAQKLAHLKGGSTKKNTTTLTSFAISNFKDRVNCKIEPYVLGVYLGDGSFSSLNNRRQHKQRSVMISNSKTTILEELSKFYKIMSVATNKTNNAKAYRFSLKEEFAKLLSEYDLEGKGSGEKFIPQAALYSDMEYRKRLLSGMIDTDGYYSKNGYSYSIVTKSKQMAEDILFLVYSLGGRGNVHKIAKTIKSINFTGEYYNISFYLGNIELPLKVKYKIRDKNFWYLSANRVSIDVILTNAQQVYGIEIDSPSKWFITDNWCITHNSTCMMQCAYHMDNTLDLDRVCFTAKQFIQAVEDAKQYQAIVFDEAQGYLSSRRALSKFNVALVQVMSEMGFKNLFIGICIPSFFELDRYPAVHRSVGLINVYKRGSLACYNYHAKKQLYFEGKKMMNYAVKPDFIGRFGKWFPLDYEAYKEKKRKFALQPLEDIQKSRLKKMADEAVDTLRGQKPDVIMDTGGGTNGNNNTFEMPKV